MKYLILLSLISSSLFAKDLCFEIFRKHNSNTIPRPLERFLKPSKKLYESLALKNPDDVVKSMLKNDTRRWIFRLEALLRLYKKSNPEMEKLLERIKGLEDAIGAHAAFTDRKKFAIEIKADEKAITHLTHQEEQTYVLLKNEVTSNWGEEGFSSFLERLSKNEWLSYKQDKQFLRKRLIKIFKKLKDKNYDLTELEDGIHELRRQIRWFLIYAHSLEGLINFHPGAGNSQVARFNDFLKNEKVRNSKYAVFYKSEKEDPILVSLPYYLTTSFIVNRIGKIKDNGEAIHSLVETYIKVGLFETIERTEREIHQLAKNQQIPIIDTYKEALKLKNFISPANREHENIFQLILDEIKAE